MSDCLREAVSLPSPDAAAWPAVVSLSLGTFGLVTAEFLPVSLLTPMAASLGVSEAVAGQTVTVTAGVALLSSLLAAVATRGIDRRRVLIGFSVLLVIANLCVASAQSLPLLLAGRVLLGIALGGFWSMAAATAIRLVPADKVPRALSLVFSGVSLATIVAAPLGSYLGGISGWRSVFLLAAAIGGVALAAQAVSLPRLPAGAPARLGTLAEVLLRPGLPLGMLCIILIFGGHFALFTYVRPFLEGVAGVGLEGMALMLLGFGLANFAGTFLAGLLLDRSMLLTLVLMPLLIGSAALGLALLPAGLPAQAAMVALWGMAFGAIPVGWSTWMARAVPDQAESGGGLLVAAVQLAIATGAGAGGLIFGLGGVMGVFVASGILLLGAAALVVAKVRTGLDATGVPTPVMH